MRAVVCKQYGPPETLVVEDVPTLTPGPGEVVISVRAAGINFLDTLIIQHKYQVKPPLPFSPGSECAGVVKAIGEGVTRVAPGDRVLAFTTYGSFAEEVCTREDRVLAVPAGMTDTTAAGFILSYGTADHALSDRGALKAGETLLILGASGGAGLAAIEVGKALGARVIACASTARKLVACVEHGADEIIEYTHGDFRERIRAVTDGRGVDVVYDPVGGSYTEPALRSLAWRGRHLVVGFAAGEIPKIPLNLTLLKGCSIVGVFWGDFPRRNPALFAESAARLGRWYREGRLRPHVSEMLPLARAAEALSRMAARQVTGKLVLLT